MRKPTTGLRQIFIGLFSLIAVTGLPGNPGAAQSGDWDATLSAARGQQVYWNAWGGDERINAYIAWVGKRVDEDYGIELNHVKLADTADAVSRVLAEKAAGRTSGGSIDLIWINGENFAAMKDNGLLHGPFTEQLPSYAAVDFEQKPSTRVDFTVPVEGLEAPWGMAKINFIYDSARVETTPRSIPDFLEWAKAHPGRFTYPTPPDFIGSTFLKQILIELVEDRDELQKPFASEARFAKVTAPLWDYLDALHPLLWRQGELFPANGPAQRQLLDDGEVDIHISFYPSEASSLISSEQLPETARVFVLEDGTIGNTHFVAIPFNAKSKEAAMVVANFLMSPEAQAEKQNETVWGDDTVLALAKLSAADRRRFDDLPRGIATLSPEQLGATLLEPHPAWMTRIETEWQKRYSR
jgi:putative thiamine transport system substrate-binding protein